ncbi:MAG: hypothetical protein ABSG96_01505 [Terracidiphilus sp.]
MNRNLTICACLSFGLLGGSVCRADEVFPVVHNEPIAVRVLNGKDGHPQAQTRVVLTAGYDRRDLRLAQWREEVLTDSAGMVQLSNALRNLPLLQVEVPNRHGCAPGAETMALSVERIRGSGMTGANRCGTAVVENAPGVFTVFVKGKKGGSKALLVADSSATVSNPPLLAAGSVAGIRAVAVAGSTTSYTVSSDGDSYEKNTSEAEIPAPSVHVHESENAAGHEPADGAADAEEDRQDPFLQFSIGPLGTDTPPSAGSAPPVGQRASRRPDSTAPAKPLHKSTPAEATHTGHSSPASAKTTGPSGPPMDTAAVASARANKPLPSIKDADERPDRSRVHGRTSPSHLVRLASTSGPTSGRAAIAGQASSDDSAAGMGRVAAAAVRLTEAQANPAERMPPTADNPERPQNRASSTAVNAVPEPSAAQTYGAVLAAVRAAASAPFAPMPQILAAPQLPRDSNSTSTPLHFRVRPAATRSAPVQAPTQTPAEEDLNSLCEPG